MEFVNGKDDPIYEMENKQCIKMFQSTNQLSKTFQVHWSYMLGPMIAERFPAQAPPHHVPPPTQSRWHLCTPQSFYLKDLGGDEMTNGDVKFSDISYMEHFSVEPPIFNNRIWCEVIRKTICKPLLFRKLFNIFLGMTNQNGCSPSKVQMRLQQT